MKTLKDEIVEALRDAAPYLDEKSEATINKLAAKVESARCEECEEKDKLLNEMAEALEEVVRGLSHGLQDSRASIAAKAMLQKYHEQEETNAE